MIPCPYHKYYYLTDDELKHQLADFKANGTRAEVVKRVEAELFELYKDPNLAAKPKQLEERGGAFYSDAACELINGIYNNKGNYMVVNVRNNGTINCLPNDSSIETTCLITSAGPIPLNSAELPVSAQGELRILKSFEQLTVEAAVTGSYGKALQALTINPLVTSGTVAKTVLDELLEAHKEYLPNFTKI
jgi:6-phospho-beta-glucosidase